MCCGREENGYDWVCFGLEEVKDVRLVEVGVCCEFGESRSFEEDNAWGRRKRKESTSKVSFFVDRFPCGFYTVKI